MAPGTRLGPYEVGAQIGVGGMGEVYKATDTNLKRAVAIKVLPASVAGDAERLARFQREAEVLGSLNHPHIAQIYGIEESNDTRALVMELVEGETLADRIAHGPLAVDEALPIAKQVAEALEAAHEQGIIHRDLKPANIKLRPDGTVKVLDFGLAKAMEPASGSLPSMSMSPTITTPAMTKAGIILGTAAYMSPEQASGKPVDKRSDIWSFGVVQFEMLTGRRLFDGETVSETLADVLRGPVDFGQLPADTPQVIRDLLRRCLNREVKKRMRDIGEARIQLEEALSGASGGTASPGPSTVAPIPSRARERLVWLSALAVVALAAVAGTLAWVRARVSAVPPAQETRLEITTLATADPFSFAISPDGRRVVFVGSTRGGASQLWLRPLEAVSAQPLAGTEGASYPFWSPDSRSVGFFVSVSLKRIDIGGGPPRTLASPGTRGGTWSPEGVILFAPTSTGPLAWVSADGGEVVAVTKLSAGQASHRFPQFLPGGRQFLFYANANANANGTEDAAGIYLASLDGTDAKRVTAADTAGVYAPPGWLFFTRQGTLVARRFDAVRGELTGDPVTVADTVAVDSIVRVGAFSVSTTGVVTYRAGGTSLNQLTWFDRSGKSLGTLGAPDATQFDPALSPDGRRVAVSRVAQANTDIWLIDAARATRFTFDSGVDRYPLWSPDGSRLVFSRVRTGVLDLYQKPSNGAGAEAVLLESPQVKAAASWSQDRRSLLYNTFFPKTSFDVWVLPMAGDPKPFPFLNSNFAEAHGGYSPDGHWVAYQSNESGRTEIYVRPFPGPGGPWQASTSGGVFPRWRRDGKELYYVAPDSTLMAVPIVVKGAAVEPGLPIALFQSRIVFGGTQPTGYLQQYDIGPDGRFLINVNTDEGTAAPITVIENWKPSN